jgi:flagellar hook-associated protein 3 FlgL
MTTRVTPRSVQQTTIDNLSANLSRMAKLQEQLASGKLINRPSDSPIQTVEAMQYRSDIRRNEQFQRNASDGLNWLGIADNTLTSILAATGRIEELTLQGMNGSTDATQRGNIAEELKSLKDTLIGLANNKYLDRPIFGGNSNASAAYATDGTFLGSADDHIERRVGPNQKVRVNITGPEVFGEDLASGGTGNLFEVIQQIADDLASPTPASAATSLANLRTRIVGLQNELGSVGARYNQVDGMRSRAEDQKMTMETGLGEVESIDLPKTIVDLQLQEIAYKTALSATARVIQPSLLDFLR